MSTLPVTRTQLRTRNVAANRPGRHSGRLERISMTRSATGVRVLLTVLLSEDQSRAVTGFDANPNTPNGRIGRMQLANAFPELMIAGGDAAREAFKRRETLIGQHCEVEIALSGRISAQDGQEMLNINLVPCNRNLSDEEVNSLFAAVPTTTPELPGDDEEAVEEALGDHT